MEKQLIHQDDIDCEMRYIIEEARVILPGVQALFGFQMIAVFNDRFDEINTFAKDCHVLGLAMVILTIAMVMTPAIYYRALDGKANRTMTRISSFMIRGALVPLAFGLVLDTFTVIFVATGNLTVGIMTAAAALLLLAALWLVLPEVGRKHRMPGHSRR